MNIFNMIISAGEEFSKKIIQISQNNRLTEREQLVIMHHLDFIEEITGSVLRIHVGPERAQRRRLRQSGRHGQRGLIAPINLSTESTQSTLSTETAAATYPTAAAPATRFYQTALQYTRQA